MSNSATYNPNSHHLAPQVNMDTNESRGTSCRQIAQPQNNDGSNVCFSLHESNTFSLKTSAVKRGLSVDRIAGSESGQGISESSRFQPYLRQFSDGALAAGCLRYYSSPLSCLQEACGLDCYSPTHSSSNDPSISWKQYDSTQHCSNTEGPAGPRQGSYFHFQSCPPYGSSSSLQEVSSALFSNNEESNSSKYSFERLSSQGNQRNSMQAVFPKPIYSYSILIFMALKNSRTGSLPVSEIYSFMTEHFPYFKTAPDGWKNSVRHNLSLNKCFEKVENKNGNSSRKGCLWALNPTKVGKMQEELYKWRRKDPITVRKSMARPEVLARLLGEKPSKLRSLVSYNPNDAPKPKCCVQTQMPQTDQPDQLSHSHISPPLQQQLSCFLPTNHSDSPFPMSSPSGRQPTFHGSVNSPVAGKSPPTCGAALKAECGVGPRSMEDLQVEEATYDVDALNPSLIDLHWQGNLWEELREDSLASDSPVVVASSVSTATPSSLQEPCFQDAVGQRKAEDTGRGERFEQLGRINGLHPGFYSGVNNLSGYLTSCTASISLM